MPYTTIQNSFTGGEISTSLFGRTDLSKWHNGASTMRNCFANYRGGSSSRAGLAYIGRCKQVGTAYPPRDIPFQFNVNQSYVLEFGDQYMRVKNKGAYVVEANNAITAITMANPGRVTYTNTNYTLVNGDWVYITGVGGITSLNGLTWIVRNVAGSTFTLEDMFGNQVDTTNFPTYTSGGNLARIFTVVAPYAAIDLPYLKYTQSADTMSLCCVNQETGTEYPPYDLVRNGDTNWVFTAISFGAVIAAPTNVSATATASTTLSTYYSYVVTAVAGDTGEESVASFRANVQNNDIAVNAGSNTITWTGVSSATSYNVFKSTPSYNVDVPYGVSYGYIGTSFGTSFTDTNITADFTNVPPVHIDPFARGAITKVNITNGGTGYAQGTVGYTVTTGTGTGFVGQPVIVGGILVAFIISNGGEGYLSADTITITGAHTIQATATFTVGPQTGTYPSVVAYYQQRRVYANTINNPDTYYFSKPGSYKNFDSSIPVTDDDAITGAPWAQQINGIQFLQPMTNGLIVLTGSGAWLLNGGASSSITPSNQTATSQAYNGCDATMPPITVDYDILYTQSIGSTIRDLSYNFFVNVFTGSDKSILSNHLFNYHQLRQWAYAEEPFKLVWVVRDDGILLCFTYLKEQDVYSWSRHDTDGFFMGVCTVTEPPVDAIYVITKRYIQNQWVYYSERMDNRNWQTPEDCFCVDAGLSYPMRFPNATLTANAADGTSNITSVELISGGSGYTSPVVRAVDPTGEGQGATFTAVLSGGVITSITVNISGSGYIVGTPIEISDSTGSGAIAQAVITNNVTFNTSSSVFSAGNVGDVIRIGNNNAQSAVSGITNNGGGQATIVTYISPTQVVANITQPITAIILDNPDFMPYPAIPNSWSLATPVTSVTGLNHLEGQLVSILGDGSVVTPQRVTNGAITLPQACSSIKVGLPFVVQLQTLYLEPQGSPTTIQGKRKNIYNATIRVDSSRGFSVGTNQPDQTVQPNNATLPWTDMIEIKDRTALITAGNAIPLFTGDKYVNVPASWDEKGQVAVQQLFPLPLNCLAIIANFQTGDQSG